MAPFLRARTVAVFAFLLASPALAGTIAGTITAADTRQPLPSMVVAVYDGAGSLRATATTDATGLFVVTVPAGDYRVLAYDNAGVYATAFDGGADSYETSRVTAVPAAGTVRVDFALPPGGTVTGLVLNPSSGAVSNAVVEVYNLSGTRRGFTTTNAQGFYSIVVPAGEYKLVAYDAGAAFAAAFYRDSPDFLGASIVRVTARQTTPAVDFRLGVAARATGNVVDATTMLPVPSILVMAYTDRGVFVASTTTDAAGAFRFALPAGRYRFVAADLAKVYAPAFYAGQRAFVNADVLDLIAGRTVTGVQIAVSRAAVLGGRVTDASGAALQGITVAAYNLDGTLHTSATSNASGRWELAVAPGELKLAAFDLSLTWATEFYSRRPSFVVADVVSVAAGQRITTYDFALVRGAQFTGTVTDAVTNQLLAGIRIAAYDANGLLAGEAVTSADGKYSLVVRPGAYRVLAFDEQLRYATRYDGGAKTYEGTQARPVAENDVVTVNFALVRGVKLTGTVTDSAGRPVSAVEIIALDLSGNHVGVAVAAAGAFALVLPPDTYRIVTRDPSGRFVETSKTIVIAEGQSPSLSLVLTGATRRRVARH